MYLLITVELSYFYGLLLLNYHIFYANVIANVWRRYHNVMITLMSLNSIVYICPLRKVVKQKLVGK